MLRHTFIMQLKPECAQADKKRHDEIWPELKMALKGAGISNYSISLHEATGTLFAYQELEEAHTADDLPQQDIVKNLMVQAIAHGTVSDLNQGRAIIKQSVKVKTYEPRDTVRWNEAYGRYREAIGRRRRMVGFPDGHPEDR